MQLFDKPEIFQPFTDVIAVQSKRRGGVSIAPFDSLNLGLSTEDVTEAIKENRHLFFTAAGIPEGQIASSHQVHGNEVWVANEPGRANGYDAVITNKPGIFAGVTVADCTPVLIYDAKNKAVAAIHAGWRGTAGNIVSNTLKKMQEQFGTEGRDCYAYIGTCISYQAFEVGAEVAEQFDKEFTHFDKEKRKYFVDLKRANLQQLLSFDIPENRVGISVKCTVLNNDEYFSFRKEKGQTGRMIALIGLRVK
ncbi:MAG: pgeF [Bacteroidetes bacterium]|jgi:YfiH family protein|nr:pgeF [Bacteroidota bacterium]